MVHGEGRRRLAGIAGEKRKTPADPEAGQNAYEKFMAVPLFLIVVIREHPNPAVREEDYAAASCIIQNLGLLGWERGIGMVWETYPLIYDPAFREALGIGPGEKVVGSLHLGYPAKIPEARPRISAEQLTTVIDR